MGALLDTYTYADVLTPIGSVCSFVQQALHSRAMLGNLGVATVESRLLEQSGELHMRSCMRGWVEKVNFADRTRWGTFEVLWSQMSARSSYFAMWERRHGVFV